MKEPTKSKKPMRMIYLGFDDEWRYVYINGEKTKYQVSDTGEIKNSETGKILVQIVDRYGYNQVCLSHKGKHYALGVHRILALAFIPNSDPEHKTQVNHKDGRKYNNCTTNLEWSTPKENTIHAYKTGLHENRATGEKHGQNKYRTKDIIYLCELLESGYSLSEASDKTKIPKHTVQDIYLRKYWTHISKDYDFSNVKKKKHTDFNSYKDEIIKFLKSGYSRREICDMLKIQFNEKTSAGIKYYERYC